MEDLIERAEGAARATATGVLAEREPEWAFI